MLRGVPFGVEHSPAVACQARAVSRTDSLITPGKNDEMNGKITLRVDRRYEHAFPSPAEVFLANFYFHSFTQLLACRHYGRFADHCGVKSSLELGLFGLITKCYCPIKSEDNTLIRTNPDGKFTKIN